jgi:hypothetical protein
MRNRATLLTFVVSALMLVAGERSQLFAAEPSSAKTASREARTPEEAKQRLQQLVDVDLVDVPLKEIGSHLQHLAGIVVATDPRAIEAMQEDKHVSFRANQIPLQKALDLILAPAGWDWNVYGATLYVTSSTSAEQTICIEVYDVRDLVYRGDDARYPEYDFDSLIQLITGLVHPTTWTEVGGTGSIKPFQSRNRAALVIGQTGNAQRDIAELLAQLRSLPSPFSQLDPGAATGEKKK